MDQTKVQQKIEGPVDGRGGGACLLLQLLQNLVCSDRFMLLPDQFENLAPDGGKALSLFKANLFGPGQGKGNALLVVMIRVDKV